MIVSPFEQESFSQSFLRVSVAVFGLIASSKFVIPLVPIPITLQMVAIYCIGLFMSPKEAFCSISIWLLLGAVGVPVFASLHGGISGPTIGYRIGMLIGGSLMGFIKEKSVISSIISCVVCCAIVHFFGSLWLALYLGSWDHVLAMGFVPFIVPEILKISVVVGAFEKYRVRR